MASRALVFVRLGHSQFETLLVRSLCCWHCRPNVVFSQDYVIAMTRIGNPPSLCHGYPLQRRNGAGGSHGDSDTQAHPRALDAGSFELDHRMSGRARWMPGRARLMPGRPRWMLGRPCACSGKGQAIFIALTRVHWSVLRRHRHGECWTSQHAGSWRHRCCCGRRCALAARLRQWFLWTPGSACRGAGLGKHEIYCRQYCTTLKHFYFKKTVFKKYSKPNYGIGNNTNLFDNIVSN